MKCQNDGKYFHGSLERAASHQYCLVKFGTGAKTSLNQYHCYWNQIGFWGGYFIAFVIPGKCQCETCLRSQYALGDWWDCCPLSSENGCCLFTACFNSLLLVSKYILFACDAPLNIHALCASSFFKCYFPFLMARKSICSDLPFLSNPWSEFICTWLPTPVCTDTFRNP